MRNPFRRRRQPTEEPQPERRDLGVNDMSWPVDSLASPAAGSVDGALRLAPVFAAGRLLSSSVASLPLQVYRRRGGERERIDTPALFERPSQTGTLRDWVFRAMTSLVYRGNAIGVVTARDYLEFPTRVEWLNPLDVSVTDTRPRPGTGSFTDPVWHVRGQRVPESDIVHIPWFVMPDQVLGLSPLRHYMTTVSTGLAAQRFSDDWFASGGVPPGRFRNAEQTVDQHEARVIKQRLMQAIRSHQPIVYGRDWEYEPITVSPNEAAFVDTMRLTATQIASIYGIPPELIGGETGGSYTYSSPEQRSIEFVQLALLPWLTTLESHLSTLLPRGQYVRFNADALIRTDAATRYANYKIAREIGLMSVDEIRALEDMAPLPGGQGDTYTPLTLQAKGAGEPSRTGPEGRRLRLVEEATDAEQEQQTG